MDDRERLIGLGWEQGLILKPVDGPLIENALYPVEDDDLLLIVSQTCDLVQGSFENEPWFEVLCLHSLQRDPNGGYLGGKNSRRIEFNAAILKGRPANWCALPHERHLIDRRLLLEGVEPAGVIDGETLKMILNWLSRRYTRTAFPEAFIQRMDARKRPIGKKFARLNPLVANVFIRLEPFEEIETEHTYTVELMLVMNADDFDDPDKYKLCEAIQNELEKQLDQCDGIEVEEILIGSTADVTIEDLKGYREWDYSYLSFRDPDKAAAPLDINT